MIEDFEKFGAACRSLGVEISKALHLEDIVRWLNGRLSRGSADG